MFLHLNRTNTDNKSGTAVAGELSKPQAYRVDLLPD